MRLQVHLGQSRSALDQRSKDVPVMFYSVLLAPQLALAQVAVLALVTVRMAVVVKLCSLRVMAAVVDSFRPVLAILSP
jgi:hypothetical protein